MEILIDVLEKKGGKAKMTFYVYENWQADDKTIIHTTDCKFCNSGKGTGKGTLGETNGKWHGPFDSKNNALHYAKNLKRKITRCCKICLNDEK